MKRSATLAAVSRDRHHAVRGGAAWAPAPRISTPPQSIFGRSGMRAESLTSMTEGSARQPARRSAVACAKKRQIASVASGPRGSL
jgi:hypothetical protein